jgi:thiopurine S-methyltransferase
MSGNKLSAQYWNQRYIDQNTPWDIGQPSPAIIKYLQENVEQSTRILIPGAGKAHEAIWLHQNGYEQVWVCDWAEDAFVHLKAAAPDFPDQKLLCTDFFDLLLEIDLVLEQTFFCALPPEKRRAYVQKTASLLSAKGKLTGLLFANPFPFQGPPFGGTKSEYIQLFQGSFEILQMDISQDSIGPRLGNELFIELSLK